MYAFATALVLASTAAVEFGYDNGYEHAHVEYGEEDRFRDIEVAYDEIEYTIDHEHKVEVRTRQIPVPYINEYTETKY